MKTNKHISAPLFMGLILAHNLIGQTNERAGVDPLTGDFQYNVPVLTVPAPEGSFNLSLNYDPNVLMLQDASWVGLGWSLSPGKISRNINVFPDDFQGENVHSVASNGGTYTLFTHDGNGHILAEWEQEYYVEDDKDENMYGSLYLGEVANTTFDEIEYPAMTGGASATLYESSLPGPFVEQQGGSTQRSPFYKGLTSNPGFHHAPVSDVHHRLPGGVNPNYVFAPTHIAFDDYMVQAPGINGSIKPYRPEVGNVSLNHAQGSANNFMRWDYFAPWLREGDADYDKMGFHYVNQTMNHYSHHLGNTTAASMQITSTVNNPVNQGYPKMTYDMLDDILYTASNRIDSRVDGTLKDNMLTADKHIRWFTNGEYASGTAHSQAGAIDFVHGSAQTAFRNARPTKGIGGFVITDENGYSYHFSLPVMRKNQYVTSFLQANPADANSSEIQGDYATDWLLTAITGPDFKDNATPGFIDGTEAGYWITFNYGLFTDTYQDRSPYDGNFRTVLSYDAANDTYIYQETYYTAEVEKYYLNSIQTRSHTALFIKNVREDARGHYDPADPADKPASVMVLEEILLFDNATFNSIPLNLSNTANENTELAGEASYNAVLDRYDWPAAYDQNYLPIQRIVLNHDYHLVPNTASSFPNAATPPTTTSYGSGGKLSLNSLDIKARDGSAAGSLEGDYQFFYSGNTNYDVLRWDGWGIPYPGGNGQGSIYVFDMAHIAPWAMNRVIDPMGAEVSVEYERDMYSNVAGNAVKDEPGNILTQRVGGGFRVRMLTTTDPQTGEQYKNRYIYTQDGSETGVSSGALAIEPLGRWHDYPIYASYDWKESPVMYAMTDVLTGYTNSTDYLERIQYQHIVPHKNMVLTEQAVDPDITYNFNHGSSTPQVIFKKANYRIHVKTSQIGNPRYVKRFSPKGHLLYQQEFRYQNQGLLDVSDPGMYSEGSILSQIALDGGDYKYYQKLFRTTKLHYPFRLESVVTMENEMSESLTYRAFDPISGMPTEIDVMDELGTTYREKLVPAYTLLPYAGMGSKVVNNGNANLLGDIAERHRFYVFPNGQEALVDVEVNTFQLGGRYRSLSGGSYTNINQSDVWRKHERYQWQNLLDDNGDGTFNETVSNTKTFHAFNHSNPGSNDPDHWRKAEEVTLLDEYSSPLEIEDINGNHRAVKKGYNEELVIAEALDARYTEFYFCGAEDPNVLSGYFGGEVNGSAYAYQSAVYAHTGNRSLRMAAGDVLPLVREVTFGTSGAEDMAEQTYVASVWVHQENKDNVSLYYKLSNGGGSGPQAWQSITSSSTKAGDWYLLTLEVPLANPAFNPYNMVEVGLDISSSCGSCYVYCDDFRLQPKGSTMTAYVYEPETRRRVAMLNNDNFGTKYVYDPLGRIIRESREQADQPSLLGGFKKVQENTYHNHTQ